jgi:hypothetical protein
MTRPAIADIVYARFVELYADSIPIRGEDDLDAAVRASGLDYDEIDDSWLRSLDQRWIYFQSNDPFQDEQVNRQYRRLLSV